MKSGLTQRLRANAAAAKMRRHRVQRRADADESPPVDSVAAGAPSSHELLPASVVGAGVVAFVAALVLVFISFLAGLVARTKAGKCLTRRFRELAARQGFLRMPTSANW